MTQRIKAALVDYGFRQDWRERYKHYKAVTERRRIRKTNAQPQPIQRQLVRARLDAELER